MTRQDWFRGAWEPIADFGIVLLAAFVAAVVMTIATGEQRNG